jgi:hypothetical protein
MNSSGSEQPIGDQNSDSFIGGFQIHKNFTGVQVVCNPCKIAVKAPRLPSMSSRPTRHPKMLQIQRGWSGPVSLPAHWAFS